MIVAHRTRAQPAPAWSSRTAVAIFAKSILHSAVVNKKSLADRTRRVATPSLAKSVSSTSPGKYPDFRLCRPSRRNGENSDAVAPILSEQPCLSHTHGTSGNFSAAQADHSGGTVADFHGLPISASQLNCFHAECMPQRSECQITGRDYRARMKLAVFPVGRALFHKGAQAFL